MALVRSVLMSEVEPGSDGVPLCAGGARPVADGAAIGDVDGDHVSNGERFEIAGWNRPVECSLVDHLNLCCRAVHDTRRSRASVVYGQRCGTDPSAGSASPRTSESLRGPGSSRVTFEQPTRLAPRPYNGERRPRVRPDARSATDLVPHNGVPRTRRAQESRVERAADWDCRTVSSGCCSP